jgi:hypothetical protein
MSVSHGWQRDIAWTKDDVSRAIVLEAEARQLIAQPTFCKAVATKLRSMK